MNIKNTTPQHRSWEDRRRGKGEEKNNLQGDYSNSVVEINRALPHDTEAESNLLRACLTSTDTVDKVQGVVKPEDFYSSGCGLIFNRLCEFRKNGQSFTPALVIESFRDHSDFDRIDFFITELGPFWTSQDWPHWARIVRDLSIRRGLVEAGVHLIEECFSLVPNVDESIETFASEILPLKERNLKPLIRTEVSNAA